MNETHIYLVTVLNIIGIILFFYVLYLIGGILQNVKRFWKYGTIGKEGGIAVAGNGFVKEESFLNSTVISFEVPWITVPG